MAPYKPDLMSTIAPQAFRKLPNPKQHDLRNAIVTFDSNHHRTDYRFRGALVNSQVNGQAQGELATENYVGQAKFLPMDLLRAGGAASDGEVGAVIDGPAADDDGTNLEFVGEDKPLGIAKYSTMYGRYMVLAASYFFTILNFHPFDIIVGLVLNAHTAFPNATNAIFATEVGSPLSTTFKPTDKPNLKFLMSLPNTKTVRIRPADWSKTGVTTTSMNTGAQTEQTEQVVKFAANNPWAALPVPGKGTISTHINCLGLLESLTKQMSGQGIDVGQHSGVFSSVASPTVNGVTLFMWVMPASSFRDYEGTIAASDDRYNAIEFENIGTGSLTDLTSRVAFGVRVKQKCILFDPTISLPTHDGIVDVNLAT